MTGSQSKDKGVLSPPPWDACDVTFPGLRSGVSFRAGIERKIQEIGAATVWQRINDALALEELMNLPEPMDLSRFELAIGGRK